MNIMPGLPITHCHTIQTLSERLRKFPSEPIIAVLLALNKHDLDDILSLETLIRDIRHITILPDNQTDVRMVTRRLFPRFIMDIEADFSLLKDMLEKMIHSKD